MSNLKKVSGIKRGVVRQKLTTFRLDNDNLLWLDSQPNKGRYINNLIRLDRLHSLSPTSL